MQDPRVAELQLLWQIERDGLLKLTISNETKEKYYGLSAKHMRELLFDIIAQEYVSGVSELLQRPKELGTHRDTISVSRGYTEQQLKHLVAGREVQLYLNHKGRVHMWRLHDELLAYRQREPFGILWDRRAWERAIAIELAMTSQERPLSVLFCDLDYFKNVNDTYGHQKGDSVLQVAFKIVRNLAEDQAYRYGGEEIAVLLPGVALPRAVALAESIRMSIETDVAKETELPRPQTVSVGVGEFRSVQESVKVAAAVDELLYKAKKTGRNRTESASF
jgi:diguanylate cyclase (GGDEF)-like protein